MAAARPRVSVRPARRWGWHPLRPDWADRLVAGSPARPGDVVVDLGAGDGALCDPLARLGCRVLAVELHPRRATALRARFAGTRVAVVEVDIEMFRWPGHRFRVVANPPYAGVNALVRRLLDVGQLSPADLVVAESAARGLLRRHPERLERGLQVPRGAFYNPPPDDARVLRIHP